MSSPSFPFEHIATQAELVEFCQRLSGARFIAFDTEFVSEDTYRPQLCLLQVEADEEVAIIDPLAIDDLSPFWNLLTDSHRETIVHAGREEFRFCLQAIGRRPANWFDLQIAAGLVGLEYPAAYSTLISKLLSRSLTKGETRTDWRRRPLLKRQLEYAIQDVKYLKPLRDKLHTQLAALQRLDWLRDELESWQTTLEDYEAAEQWQRVSGITGLNRRQLAIVRQLWRWRDQEARQRDCPPRRVLRDDLVVELARRQTDDPQHIRALRGMEFRNISRRIPEVADNIRVALELPDEELPQRPRRQDAGNSNQLTTLGQFLAVALGCICRDQQLAPPLVGSVQDVRDLVAHRLGLTRDHGPPALARGWRAEVVGSRLDELVNGQAVLRVLDPHDEHPLSIHRLDE